MATLFAIPVLLRLLRLVTAGHVHRCVFKALANKRP
jgi:hypothetical protein